MNGMAIALELSTLLLAIVVLVWDLIFPARKDEGRGDLFLLATVGLVCVLALSFAVPSSIEFTYAFVLDGFALFTKRTLVAAALLAVAGLYPYAGKRDVADRAGETLVLLLFATVGGMTLC